MIYRFGDHELNPEAYTLTRLGTEVAVEPRILETLTLLILERHRVVSKEELLERVWKVEFASEATLHKAIQQARRAVGDDGRNQHTIKTVHGAGYRFIAEVAEPDAAPSPATSAPSVIDSLEAPPERRNRWRLRGATIAGVLLVVIVALVWLMRPGLHRSRPVVAIVHTVAEENAGWEDRTAHQLVELRLRAEPKLRVIPTEVVRDLLQDANLDPGRPVFPSSVREMERWMEGGHVVLTTVRRMDDDRSWQLEAEIVGRHEANTIVQTGVTLSEAADALSRAVAQRILGQTDADPWTPIVSDRAYGRLAAGSASLRDGDLSAAVSILAPLVSEHPDFARARLVLARTYAAMGVRDAAAREARTAFELGGDLAPRDRLETEALFHEVSGAWDQAAAIHRTLLDRFPDDPEQGLALIRALRWSGATGEALRLGADLDDGFADDPRLHLEVSRVHQIRGDLQAQTRALERARAVAERTGSRSRVPSAILGLGWSALVRGDDSLAEQLFLEALDGFRQVGNRRGESRCLAALGAVLSYGPDPARALSPLERAAVDQRRRGDLEDLSKSLYSTATVLALLGRHAEALVVLDEVLANSRRTGDRETELAAMNRLGDRHSDLGDNRRAIAFYLEALPLAHELGARRRLVDLTNSLGIACRNSGDFGTADIHFSDSARLAMDVGDRTMVFSATYNRAGIALQRGRLEETTDLIDRLRDLEDLNDGEQAALEHLSGDLALERDQLPAAVEHARAAVRIRTEHDPGDPLINSELLLGLCLAETGNTDDAMTVIDRAAARAEKQNSPTSLLAALTIRGAIALDSGRPSEALASARRAAKLVPSGAHPDVQVRTLILLADAGDPRATEHLERALEIAEDSGLAPLALRTRIAMTRTGLASPETRPGLADEAQRRGWLRLARLAETVRH